MKRIGLMFAAATLLAGAPEDGIPGHPRDLKYPARVYNPPKPADYRHKLSNGATAFLVEDHDFPLININVMVRVGEYVDPAGKIGLAALTASQIRSGGTKSKAPAVFDEEAAFLAANISSAAGPLESSAALNCLSKDIDAGLALFVDMLHNPGFAEDRLKLAKTQLMQSMERRNDALPGIENREFQRLMRGKHFSALQPTKATIDSLTRDDLIDFHSKYYYPANFIFAVSGDFKTADMLAKLEKAFANWPAGSKPAAVPKPDFTPKAGIYLVDKKGVNQGRVTIGHLGTMMTNPDHIAITVMNGILGGNGFTSRITTRVRSDEGLAYQAASGFQHGFFYDGLFTVRFQSKSPTVAQAVAIVEEEIDKIRKNGVTAEELDTEKNFAIESFPRRFASAAAKAGQFANDFYTGMPDDYWQEYRDRVRSLTVADMQRVAQKYLKPDQLVILAVGDLDAILKGNPDKPEFQLAKLGKGAEIVRIPLPDPLTMVYPQ